MQKILFLILLIFSTQLFSNDITGNGPSYASCGPRPSLLSRMISDAEKMREKCITDVFNNYVKARDKEVDGLLKYAKYLQEENKKYAIKVTLTTIDCGNENKRDLKLVQKCQSLNDERNAVLKRVDKLMGWDQEFKKAASKNVSAAELPTPSCPTDEELLRLRGVRYFNPSIYKMWENCVYSVN